MRFKKLAILLADDNEEDIFFVKRATANCEYVRSLHVVRNGEEAIHYLSRLSRDGHRAETPNLLLLDLKMPMAGGFEVLEWIRSHAECGVVPTIVYSSSRMERDVVRAYRLGANAYFVKPFMLNDLLDFLRLACEFWSKCECPSASEICIESAGRVRH